MQEFFRQIFLIPMIVIATIVNFRDTPQRLFKGSSAPISISSGNWEVGAPLPTQRYDFGASVFDGKLYIVGGLVLSTPWLPTDRVDAYNSKTNTWDRVADFPRVIHHPAVVTCDNTLYVVAGYWIRVVPSQFVYAYDALKNSWIKKSDIPVGRGALAASCLDGKIYAMGGETGDKKQISSLHVYDTKSDTWQVMASMPTAREHLASVAINGKIYAIGGLINDRFNPVSINEAYDPLTNSWKTMAPLPIAISGHTASVFGDSIFVFGGASGDAVSSEVFEYKTKEDTWHRRKNMPSPRYGLVSGAIDGKLHVIGGNEIVKGNFFSQDHDILIP